ncbi:MAG TPA: hypothetical protein DCS93_08740 [Microscillaceae bacterium]|nr:hypothetical protein [Microscillaceae bacterium]
MGVVQFRSITIDNGKQETVDFGSRVINASVAVQGFDISFSKDHHLREMKIKAGLGGISGSQVTATATATMRDDSNHHGSGSVNVLIIAETDA